MARKTTASAVDVALERVRSICMGFPATDEKLSHGAPSFFVRGKMFLTFVDDHHDDGRLAVWCKAEPAEQRRLVADDADRFFVPPYVGVKGWVGARLDRPDTDWIGLAILIEQGWASVAPSRVRDGAWVRTAPVPPPPPRPQTNAKIAREALERTTGLCLALPEASCEAHGKHATFRVRKKVFAYFLDNHHGDAIVAVCVKMGKAQGAALLKRAPERFYKPAYIGAKGWVGIRLDQRRIAWKDVAGWIGSSYASVAPKSLLAKAPTRPGRA